MSEYTYRIDKLLGESYTWGDQKSITTAGMEATYSNAFSMSPVKDYGHKRNSFTVRCQEN